MTLTPQKMLVLVCAVVLLGMVSLTKVSDYDFWWHLKLGETIFQTQEMPSLDTFSYTFQGSRQFESEWLADLLLYLVFRHGGYPGIALLKIILLVATFALLLKANTGNGEDPKGITFFAAIIILLLIVLSIKIRLFPRPFLFSYLFLSLFLFALGSFERSGKQRILFVLPFAELLWANTSKGAFLGPLVLFLFVATHVRRKEAPVLFVLSGLVVLSSLANPEGYRLYSWVLNLGMTQRAFPVGENQPLSAELLWGYGIRYTVAYQLLVLLSVLSFVVFRGWRNLYHTALFVVFLAFSVLMVRMIDFFSLVTAVFASAPVEKALNVLFARARRPQSAMAGVTVCLVILLMLVPLSGQPAVQAVGLGVKPHTFAEDALSFLDRERIGNTLFNSYPFGGYILWRSPERKVFIDGRAGQLYPAEFFHTYLDIVRDADSWKSAEERWGFDYAVVEYDVTFLNRHFPVHLNENPGWALIYWDDHSAVYVKRRPEYSAAIRQYEYTVVKPHFYNFSYLMNFAHGGSLEPVIGEIDREIRLNPQNQEPRLAKAFLLFAAGYDRHSEEIFREVSASLALMPDLAMEHSAMAKLLVDRGLLPEAERELKRSLSIDPHDRLAQDLKRALGSR